MLAEPENVALKAAGNAVARRQEPGRIALAVERRAVIQMAEDYGLNFSFEPSKVVTCAYIKPSFVTYASDPL